MAELFRFESARRFRMWSYSVSHSRVLLTSPRSDADPTRLDIMFYGVTRMHVDTSMDGVVIAEDAERNAAPLRGGTSLDGKGRLFRVASRASEGWLIAREVRHHEDGREYWERSALDPAPQNRAGMREGTGCELWCRDGSGAPEVVVVRKSSDEFVVREAGHDGAALFRDDRYDAVREWLEARHYDFIAERLVHLGSLS